MASLSVPCSKGCGSDVPVDEQTINNAVALGVTLNVAHDVCPAAVERVPNDPETVEAHYRIQLFTYRVPDDADLEAADWQHPDGYEVLAGAGTTVAAPTYVAAVARPFTDWLTRTWPQLQEKSPAAEWQPSPATDE